MNPIEYRRSDISDVDRIRPLWFLLNDCMHTKTHNFKTHFEQMTFESRREYFEKLARAGTLCIDLAFDFRDSHLCVGYCVSSLSQEKTGEIESLFVKDSCRSQGIGSTLVTRALAWMDDHGSTRNRVSVSEGNEQVGNFYEKFGFYPRMTVLEQKKGVR